MIESSLTELERLLPYGFKNKDLLDNALRHTSFVNEQQQPGISDNERLEFLGDAVLNIIISHMLMVRFPELNEGDLSRTRSFLVNETRLAEIALTLELGRFIRLGKGEILSGGQTKKSILADAYEAVVAAVYLDGGFDCAFEMVSNHFADHFDDIAQSPRNTDYKSRLQEMVQATMKLAPEYRLVKESGPDHDKTFEVLLEAGDLCASGTGKSKKAAEQQAARRALKQLSAGP